MVDADHAVLAPDAEAAQPLYARYWLHNRGPAPLGGLPAVAHLHPPRVIGEPDSVVLLRLTASSDCSDAALHGRVRLVCPEGWAASPAELPFVLPPGEHLETDLELTVPREIPPGLYPVRAELAVTGSDAASMPAAWRQMVEDVCVVSVGAPSEDLDVLRLISGPEAVVVTAGESGRLAVTVGTDARTDLAVEAHLISPWGTWEWIGPAAAGAHRAGRGERGARIRRIASGVGRPGRVVGPDPRRLRRLADLFARGDGDGPVSAVAATVGGIPIRVDEVDAREAALRAGPVAATLPRAGTSEGRQLRRWLTQLLATERVVAAEAAALSVDIRPCADRGRAAARRLGPARHRERRRRGAGGSAGPRALRAGHGRGRGVRRRGGRLPRPQPAAIRDATSRRGLALGTCGGARAG